MVCGFDSEVYDQWLPFTLMLAVGSFIVLGILYMFSQFKRNSELKAKIKTWFIRWIGSAVIVSLVVMATQLLCQYSALVYGVEDPFAQAEGYLSTIEVYFTSNYNSLWNSIFDMRSWSSITWGVISCYQGGCFAPHAGLNYLYYQVDMIINLFIPISASITFQRFILMAVNSYFMPYLFPLGLTLMFSPVTRDAGAYLVSLVLGFYFLFPFVYLVSYAVFNDNWVNDNSWISDLMDELDNSNIYQDVVSINSIVTMFTRLAILTVYAYSVPLLAIMLSVAAARGLYPFLSNGLFEEVNV